MKVKDIIKKQTTIIALAVIVVVMATIGVSYAVFFDVKNSDTQVITAGTLSLTLNGVTALQNQTPMSEATANTSNKLTYTIKNGGNLPAKYGVYIYNDTGNINLAFVKVKINGGAATPLASVTKGTLTDNSKTYYKVEESTVAAGSTTTSKTLTVWVDEESINTELSSAKLDLKLYLVSEVNES